jgi:hypothetical protein
MLYLDGVYADDCMDGGGRAKPGARAESNAWSSGREELSGAGNLG